jgi:hypothetical protein
VAAGSVAGSVLVGTGNQVITADVVVTDSGALLGAPAAARLGRPLVGLPRLPSRVFVGRADTLAVLDVPVGGAAVVTQVVAGLGGIGKTELALHYCHARRDGFPILWWISADSAEAIEAGLAALTMTVAAAVGRIAPPKTTDAAEWAVALLNAHPGWLLVMDNVEDQTYVESWLARLSAGRVLITSRRDTGWEDLADTCIRLDLLDLDAAMGVLTEHGGPHDAAADATARELGRLPLALTQAAAYVTRTRTPMGDCLARLRSQPTRMLAAEAPGGRAQQTVARVWELTLAAIDAVDPFAIDILRVLSCLAPDNVPRNLLTPMSNEPGAVDVALGLLASYSMITLVEQSVSVHRPGAGGGGRPDPVRRRAEAKPAQGA